MANDIGLRSYQDIEMPEEPKNPLSWASVFTDADRRKLRDELLIDFFREVLEVQEETKRPFWFDWMPTTERVVVYSNEGEGTEIDMVLDTHIDAPTEEDLTTLFDNMFYQVFDYRDKILAKRLVGKLKAEIKEREEKLKELEKKYGKES